MSWLNVRISSLVSMSALASLNNLNAFLSIRFIIVASNPLMFGVPMSFLLSTSALTTSGGSTVGRSLSYIPSYITFGSLPYLRYVNIAPIGLMIDSNPIIRYAVFQKLLPLTLSLRFFIIMSRPS